MDVFGTFAYTVQGPERIKGAYAYQTLLKASPKGILPLGSDFPVESINPLYGVYAAVSRLDVEGKSPYGESGWYVLSFAARILVINVGVVLCAGIHPRNSLEHKP